MAISRERINLGASEVDYPSPGLPSLIVYKLWDGWKKVFWKVTQNKGAWGGMLDFYRDHGGCLPIAEPRNTSGGLTDIPGNSTG